jgi:hypothetical protein
MADLSTLTQKRLNEVLFYHPDTGVFTWKFGRPKAAAGAVAGGVNWKGYWLICIDGKKHRAHRLAWLHTYGAMPKNTIDHINQNKMDNRIENLRDVTNAQNHKNMGMQSNNETGFRGVSYAKERAKFTARIKDGDVYRNLGYFKCAAAASIAYEKAKALLGYHRNHGISGKT